MTSASGGNNRRVASERLARCTTEPESCRFRSDSPAARSPTSTPTSTTVAEGLKVRERELSERERVKRERES